MANYFEGPRRGRRRETIIAGVFLLLAFFLFFLPAAYQGPVRSLIRGTALRPFLAAQVQLADRRSRAVDILELRAERDSLAAVVAAQATLAEDNRRLRELLGLAARAQPQFKPAEVLVAGVPGAESTFMVNLGRRDGVRVGSAVLSAGGLLGVVRELDDDVAQALDWTHPDFRVSAMTADGEAYGMVQSRRGRFREEDLLVLTSAPFHSDIRPGTWVVSSGRGGIYARGIRLGVVVGIEEADTGWRKSYLVRPAVRPEAATHVLVGVYGEGEGRTDLSELWNVVAPPDTVTVPDIGASGEPGNGPARPSNEP